MGIRGLTCLLQFPLIDLFDIVRKCGMFRAVGQGAV